MQITDIFCYFTAAVLLLWYVMFVVFVQHLGSWKLLLFLPFVAMALIVGSFPIRNRRSEMRKIKKRKSKKRRKEELLMKLKPHIVEGCGED